jgi:hypothetical protein
MFGGPSSRLADSEPAQSRLDTGSTQEPVFVSFEMSTTKSPHEYTDYSKRADDVDLNSHLPPKPSLGPASQDTEVDMPGVEVLDDGHNTTRANIGSGRLFENVTTGRISHSLEERAMMRQEVEAKRREEASLMFRKQI